MLFIVISVDAAAVSSKPIRQGRKAQAGLVSGTASAAFASKTSSKKRSRREILLSEDDSVPGGEKTLNIQMQHTITTCSACKTSSRVARTLPIKCTICWPLRMFSRQNNPFPKIEIHICKSYIQYIQDRFS